MNNIDINSNASSTTTSNPMGPADAETAYGEAYQRRMSELMALQPNDLLAVNLDVRAAIASVVGLLPKLTALRPRIAKLPELDMALFDGLADYASAMGHAHSKFLGAGPQAAELATVNEAAVKVRDTLMSDAHALGRRGIIDPGRLDQFKGLNGYKNVSFDVMGLADLLIECWPQIQNKSPITLTELRDAKALAEKLMAVLGSREQSAPVVAEAASNRQRAYTLFARAYDEARRAVTYLRWKDGDFDSITPSLYAGRGGRSKSDGQDQADPGAPQAGTAPAPVGSGTPPAVNGTAAVNPAAAPASPSNAGAAPAANGSTQVPVAALRGSPLTPR